MYMMHLFMLIYLKGLYESSRQLGLVNTAKVPTNNPMEWVGFSPTYLPLSSIARKVRRPLRNPNTILLAQL